jgi:hypothetical protein
MDRYGLIDSVVSSFFLLLHISSSVILQVWTQCVLTNARLSSNCLFEAQSANHFLNTRLSYVITWKNSICTDQSLERQLELFSPSPTLLPNMSAQQPRPLEKDENESISSSMGDSAYMSQAESGRKVSAADSENESNSPQVQQSLNVPLSQETRAVEQTASTEHDATYRSDADASQFLPSSAGISEHSGLFYSGFPRQPNSRYDGHFQGFQQLGQHIWIGQSAPNTDALTTSRPLHSQTYTNPFIMGDAGALATHNYNFQQWRPDALGARSSEIRQEQHVDSTYFTTAKLPRESVFRDATMRGQVYIDSMSQSYMAEHVNPTQPQPRRRATTTTLSSDVASQFVSRTPRFEPQEAVRSGSEMAEGSGQVGIMSQRLTKQANSRCVWIIKILCDGKLT